MRGIRAAALGATAACLLAGTAACSGDSGSDRPDGAASEPADGQGSVSDAFAAVRAAAETTQEITSADFDAVMRSPQAAGGNIEMTGAMSWAPELAMDLTVTGEALAQDPAAPDSLSVVWVDGVMYLNMGPDFAAEFDGRTWMAMDLMALADQTGDETLSDAMSFGLDEANQDPAQQLALLLQSPEIQPVGEETLDDGTETSHYQGTITVEDALASNGAADLLTEEERQQLADAMGQQGIESYDIDVWVDGNDFPVQIHQSYDTTAGPVEYEVRYSDFGTEVDAQAPPAGSVVDFMELMEELESAGAAGGF